MEWSFTRVFRLLTHAFALIGLTTTVIVGLAYVQGWQAIRHFDPKAAEVFAELARRTLESDSASANVIKMPLEDGVSVADAIEAMMRRAEQRNIKLVARLPYHKEVEARTGQPFPFAEIFLFCDAGTAARVLELNRDYLAYMPCSIALFEDGEGRNWLVTTNLDLLIYGGPEMAPTLRSAVEAVKDGLLDIMAAGATGAN